MNIFEKIYLFFYLRKKEKALRTQKRLPFPVISVGNLTVGGTGKTPFTIALAKELKKRQCEPVVLTRGYKGKLKGPVIVTETHSPEDVGDEPVMMACEGLKVIKGIDRYEGGLYAIEKFGLTHLDKVIFILDDGFQHRSLYRDLNILLIDGYSVFGNTRLIPFGPLRSPLSELSEADMIFITKKRNEALYEKLSEMELKNIYFAPLKIEGIRDVYGKKIEPVGQTIYAFAGVGNFQSFKDCLKELNFKIIGHRKFFDHKKYSEKLLKKIARFAEKAELIVTTKKDFVKIKNKTCPFINRLCYLDISLKIDVKIEFNFC